MGTQQSRKPKAFRQIEGCVSGFRIGAPADWGRGAVRIDDLWVFASLDDFAHEGPVNTGVTVDAARIARSTGLLGKLARAQTPVRAGLVPDPDGDWTLAWLLSPAGNLIPLTRAELRKKGWRIVLRWLPWVLLSGALVVTGIAYFMVSFAFVLLVIGAGVALLICGIGWVLGIRYVMQSFGRLQTLSEAALLRARRSQAAPRSSSPSPSGPCAPPAPRQPASPLVQTDDAEAPPLYKLSGCATHIQVQRRTAEQSMSMSNGAVVTNVSGSINYTVYTFWLEATPCVLYASRTFDGGNLFLAEGDRVDAVLSTAPTQATSETPGLVWAARNQVDGRAYACHRIMSPVANRFTNPLIGKARMTQVTPRYLAGARSYAVAIWALALLLVGSIGIWNARDGGAAGVLPLLAVIGFGLPAMWLIVLEGPIRTWRWKWRRGHPSKRQRLTERVYRLLGMDPPNDAGVGPIDV